MSNLKELKNRIGSVKSTSKITGAMKMVAASKLRRAQERAEQARPFSSRMTKILEALTSSVALGNAPELLTGRRDIEGNPINKTHLIIIATADKGLCGGFNSSIVKGAKSEIQKMHSKGKNVKIITLGRKGLEQLRFGYGDSIIHKVVTNDKNGFGFSHADSLTKKIINLFNENEIDSCSIIYNKFINALTQDVTFQHLIPLETSDKNTDSDKNINNNNNEAINSNESNKQINTPYEYEPDEETVINDIIPRNIAAQIFHAILENGASEQGARMTAMDNATRNAGEMIDKLTLKYNRSRQAAITTELTEIIAGSEAV